MAGLCFVRLPIESRSQIIMIVFPRRREHYIHHRTKRATGFLELSAVGNDNLFLRGSRLRSKGFNLLDNVHAFHDRSKDTVLAVQPGGLDGTEEDWTRQTAIMTKMRGMVWLERKDCLSMLPFTYIGIRWCWAVETIKKITFVRYCAKQLASKKKNTPFPLDLLRRWPYSRFQVRCASIWSFRLRTCFRRCSGKEQDRRQSLYDWIRTFQEAFSLKTTYLSTSSVVVGEVTSLAHELRNDTVEGGTLVSESLFSGAQGTKVFGSLGNNISAEFHDDAALRLIRDSKKKKDDDRVRRGLARI